MASKRSKSSSHQSRRATTAGTTAMRKGSSLWTDPVPLMPSTRPGSDLWTTRPGKREIWSWVTYAINAGKKANNAVKIFVMETSMENKKRFVGPTFHTAPEAKKYCIDNVTAWPGDREALNLDEIRSEGLLKAWSKVWAPEVEQAVKSCSESVDRFLELFNEVGKGLHVKVPKTFTDQLILQVHKEHGAKDPLKYGRMGGYFFPDRPGSLTEEDEEKEKTPEKEEIKEQIPQEAPKEPENPKTKRSFRNRFVIFFDEAKKGAKLKLSMKKKEKKREEKGKDEAQTGEPAEDEAKDEETPEDSLKSPPTEDQPKKCASAEETPVHRRIYAFASITVDTTEHKVLKYAFVRSRVRGDHYFVAVTPDFGTDDVEALKTFFEQDKAPYPDFEFDAKWMLEEMDECMAAPVGRTRSLF